jgi:hypothetical protein
VLYFFASLLTTLLSTRKRKDVNNIRRLLAHKVSMYMLIINGVGFNRGAVVFLLYFEEGF